MNFQTVANIGAVVAGIASLFLLADRFWPSKSA